MEIKKPDKKSLWYLGVVLLIAILAGVGFFYYFSLAPEVSLDEEMFKELQRQKMIKKQLQELEELRGDVEPLTEEEIQKQIEELDKLRKFK